ncbi:acyl-CoA dehydrogenase/oxidase C-terminal [Phellopilus nigrolimitatus]|nr:acyl-CoA dehydrogenase/oxidase C-terminal [Phellopilus nigrolimitatus]
MGGYAGIDNGYARFDRLRIPRFQMLSRFAQVTKEGNYVKPPHAKLSYGGMLYIRSGMVSTAGRSQAKAATISLRYATVRRQGNKGADGLERQIITYPSVHHRLLPILSRAYVYILLGRNLTNSQKDLLAQLNRGDTSYLAEMHAMTSGLKVLVTTTSMEDIEVARRSMGGHGYSAYSALGYVYANALPSVTYEGDNFVLDQQVVRAALKVYQDIVSCKAPSSIALSPFSAYLRLLKTKEYVIPQNFTGSEIWSDWRTPIHVLEWRAARAVKSRALAQAIGEVDASADQRVSRAVTEAYVAAQVGEMISTLPFTGSSASIVKSLLRLYLLSTVETALTDILSFGLIPPVVAGEDPTKALRMEIARLCAELVPEAISLTDAFGYTDWELDSALGVYDGRVYEALWKRVQAEPLNQTEVTDGYEEFIKPLLERGRRLASDEQSKSKL